MTAETVSEAVRPTCPTCGAKITQAHLSLCAYCGSPLALGDEKRPKDRATMRRLAQMHEHEDFAEAAAWEPPEGPDTRHARAAVRAGALLAAAGLALCLGAGPWRGWIGVLPALGAALVALGLVRVARNLAAARAGRRLPLLKRPALVASRRSETDAARGRTTYWFEVVFEDGSTAELRYPGRGANHDPLVPGNTGLAYTRANELLAFRAIRV
jgi:hypothetical protein